MALYAASDISRTRCRLELSFVYPVELDMLQMILLKLGSNRQRLSEISLAA
jgi:hypothetical protein